MSNLFGENSGVHCFLSRLADDLLYSILTLICSVPVVTAGTALTALFDLIMRSETHREAGAIVYFRRFAFHFRRTMISWIGLAAADALWIFAFRYVPLLSGLFRTLLFGFLFFALWVLIMLHLYLPPLFVAEREGNFLSLWKEAVFTGIALLPRSLLMMLAALVPVLFYMFDPAFFWGISFLWLFFWPALAARIFFHLIQKYFPEFSDLPPADPEE